MPARKSKGTVSAESARRLGLALALAPGAVSVDTLVQWNLARPVELWSWLDVAQEEQWIVEDVSAGQGCFRWQDAVRKAALLDESTLEDWRLVACCPELINGAALAVHDAGRERNMPLVERIGRALVQTSHERFPDGERGWVRVVVGCIRIFRSADWLGPTVVNEALAAAVACGDLRSQVTLQCARAFLGAGHGDRDEPRQAFAAAQEAALAIDDPNAEGEFRVYQALTQFMEGRLKDCIRQFEATQRDLPYEVFTASWKKAEEAGAQGPWECPFGVLQSPVPESPLCALAWVHALTGGYPQALDIVHRLDAMGEQQGRRPLVLLARAFLAGLLVEGGDPARARVPAKEAFEFWRSAGYEPQFRYLASVFHAWSLWRDGRLDEAQAMMEEVRQARIAPGALPHYPGSALLDLLEWIDVESRPPIDGLTLDGELARLHHWPDIFMQGVAHRFSARRQARRPLDNRSRGEVDEHLARSLALLREAGAAPELARTLDESAAWAEQTGRAEDAARLRGEARDLRAGLPKLRPAENTPGPTPAVLAERFLHLGRIGCVELGQRRKWGDIAARLSEDLGAERCALVETSAEPQALTARGGDATWIRGLLELLRRREPRGVEFLEPVPEPGTQEPGGRLILVPFAAQGTGHHGWVCFENRHGRALVGPADAALLEVLGIQIGVLVENVSLWRDLEATRRRLEQELNYYRQQPATTPAGSIVGHSVSLQKMLNLVDRVAPTQTAVLVLGETGSGKELVAREVHHRSNRKTGPFIAVHIASLAPGLVASGLFGHERGAFTGATELVKGRFELADRGTLFLDEIGELGPDEQVRLLRVLQEGVFERVGGTRPQQSDFRLVAATNRDLEAEVRAGRFREDLFYRLNVFPIRVPPLRERPEDIPTLALYFMERVGRNAGRRFDGISEADMRRLQEHAWPGNVRELQHLIERAALLSEPPRLRIPPLSGAAKAPASVHRNEREWVRLDEAERRYIREVLEHTGGRITGSGAAAEILGLNPSTLNFRIGKLGLRPIVQRIRSAGSSATRR
ncbi:MAG: sigma-54-dependent Fis family transcriptional regulator [Deltaproteobacteria bacterium]|nr:sigma-54-dependent Fis family transcriptional regulator [Deltaproteobacteria bacterium]